MRLKGKIWYKMRTIFWETSKNGKKNRQIKKDNQKKLLENEENSDFEEPIKNED